jgi:aquaporin Z
MARKIAAEMLGTALLVFFAVGVATLSFGFGTAGSSFAAGVVATALAFGLTLLVLVYALGPISGCHVNPAVTTGALLARRITWVEAVGYWVAQFIGGILGALLLWGMFDTTPFEPAWDPRRLHTLEARMESWRRKQGRSVIRLS